MHVWEGLGTRPHAWQDGHIPRSSSFQTIHDFVDLPIWCILVNAKGRSKWGRPGTEATWVDRQPLSQAFTCPS